MDTTGKTIPRQVAQAGQGLVEYALILALIAVLAISATLFLGGKINTVLSNVGNSVVVPGLAGYPKIDGGRCDANPNHHWDQHHDGSWTCGD